MTGGPGPAYWRVGYHLDPVGFVPHELCSWSNRFDDAQRRFRSVYIAEHPETALREVLSDLRPNAAAVQRFVERFGRAAAAEVPSQPVTLAWRAQNVLVRVEPLLDGPVVDLCDPGVRNDLERHHAELLAAHHLDHLDLSAVTATNRTLTRALASDARRRLGAAAVRFPSRHDGLACLAVFEGGGELRTAGDPVALLDPPPALAAVCGEWNLRMER